MTEHKEDTDTSTSATARGRFDVYIIDSGWHTEVRRAVHDNIEQLKEYLSDQNLYILSESQSTQYLKQHPELVGLDPVLLFIDRERFRTVAQEGSSRGFGFQLNLGRVPRRGHVIALIKWVAELANDVSRNADIVEAVKQEAHKEGMAGTINIMMNTIDHQLMPE